MNWEKGEFVLKMSIFITLNFKFQKYRIKWNVIKVKGQIIITVVTIYTIFSYSQRQHLFVWSVFAPKLIYQIGDLIIQIVFILFIHFY
jgi:hypothetical protein